jgi:hypothetical protein
MSFCFITSEDLLKGDEHVQRKIADNKRAWKYLALHGEPRHGFMIVCCERNVLYARPDDALKQFALHFQRLVGWPTRDGERGNDIVDEWLYLKHPTEDRIVKFTFSVDFFAAAGDKRWWHDHRVPGGIAFTANSLGHMARHLEWYQGKDIRTEWALRTAMLTIDTANREMPHTPATYLLDETDGRPRWPYTWPEGCPVVNSEKLRGKDRGSYAGHLHTDHAVRAEFFRDGEEPLHKLNPYDMDFMYIFDPNSDDYPPFMVGHPATREEVEHDIGRPEEAELIAETAASYSVVQTGRPGETSQRIQTSLERSRRWRMSDEEEELLLR